MKKEYCCFRNNRFFLVEVKVVVVVFGIFGKENSLIYSSVVGLVRRVLVIYCEIVRYWLLIREG